MSNSIWFWNATDKNSEITLSLSNTKKTVKYNKDVIISALNITINQGDTFDITLSIQVEEGTIETGHIKHEQTNYNLPIQQEMLKGDYFAKEADGWKEAHYHPKLIFTGDENWGKSSNTSVDRFTFNTTEYPAFVEGFSNYFIITKGITLNKGTLIFNDGKQIIINFSDYGTTTLEQFKAWLQEKYNSGNPVYVYYKTTTPTKLPCTEEQSAVLEELNNLDLFSEVNNIITAEDIALLILKYIQQTNEKINNEGNVESRPILRLEKTVTDKVELTINNCRFKYNFNNEEYVKIDCEEKEVKYEGLNRNRQIEIDYEFPILNIGNNDIKMHSGDCIIKVLRKDRWL